MICKFAVTILGPYINEVNCYNQLSPKLNTNTENVLLSQSHKKY